MVTNKASIRREEDNTYLVLEVDGNQHKIVLTEDNPNNIKSVFNNLLMELKKGQFNFELEDEEDDLYFHICKEYVVQLNQELVSVHGELREYDLLEEEEKEISKIICIGDVHIQQGKNETFSDRAIYLAREGRIVLTGSPRL
ncbi:MAG: hypothetical protein IH948_10725, partial [Bacteroidetes bacterium]|nr:hypothetical protein [Bacteroidota bacterium]